MNRRTLLMGTAGLAVFHGSSTSLVQNVSAEEEKPVVWDLGPEESAPEGYDGYMTIDEINEHIRRCSRGRIQCYPILAGEIPKARRFFKTWSLFLISNPQWLSSDGDEQLRQLHGAYAGFARAVGPDHAAVFFWKKAPKIDGGKLVGTDLAANIDADRCSMYARTLKLDISDSPHVVVMRTRPSPDASLGDRVILTLNGLLPSSTQELLTLLATQLISDHLDSIQLDSERYWLTWKDVLTKVYETLGRALPLTEVEITTGPVRWKLGGKR
jgi:hypothetical protein